jgi:Fe-S-cluster containining protein
VHEKARWRVRLPLPRGGTAEVEIAALRGPTRLAWLAGLAFDLTDFLVERAIEAERAAGRDISCRAGCGACCRQLVGISPPEAFALADAVVALPGERRDRVMESFDRTVAEIDARGFGPRLASLRHDHASEDLPEFASGYFRLGIACPLLENESCGLYEARPCSCREYNVTSDPAFCADPGRGEVRRIAVGAVLSRPLAEITARLVGGEPALVPLSHALQFAEENAGLAFRTWPGVELAEAFLAIPGRGE